MRGLLYELKHAERDTRHLLWLPRATRKEKIIMNVLLSVAFVGLEYPALYAFDGLLVFVCWVFAIFFAIRAAWALTGSWG